MWILPCGFSAAANERFLVDGAQRLLEEPFSGSKPFIFIRPYNLPLLLSSEIIFLLYPTHFLLTRSYLFASDDYIPLNSLHTKARQLCEYWLLLFTFLYNTLTVYGVYSDVPNTPMSFDHNTRPVLFRHFHLCLRQYLNRVYATNATPAVLLQVLQLIYSYVGV